MKSNRLRKVTAFLITVALMVASMTSPVYAAENTNNTRKDETVYVKMDLDGEIDKVIVSNQIKNIRNASEISDISNLTDIVNVKGDQQFTHKGDQLIWENDGESSICYQGSTQEKLPVGIKIKYELDGKEVKPEELEAKTGHLKITYTYENMSGTGNKFMPFVMLTSMTIDEENFDNITVENGKIISDGDRDMIIGYGIPGLRKYLDLTDNKASKDYINIPEYFVFEADIVNYKEITAITVATNEIFNEFSTGKLDSLDDLQSSMNELQDASNKLVDGSGKLKDGLSTLLSSSYTLKDGVNALVNGGNELSNGSGTLVQGTEVLSSGAKNLAEGTSSLQAGADKLVDGSGKLVSGVGSVKKGASDLNGGIDQIIAGVESNKAQTAQGIQTLSEASDKVLAGIPKLGEGAANLNAGVDTLAEGLGKATAGVGVAQAGLQGIKQSATEIINQASQSTITDNQEVSVNVDNSQERDAVAQALRDNGIAEEVINDIISKIPDKTVSQTIAVTFNLNADNSAIIANAEKIIGTQEAINQGLTQLSGQLTGAQAMLKEGGQFKDGMSFLAMQLSEQGDLYKGMTQINSGINTLGGGLSSGMDTISGAMNTLKDGNNKLIGGLDSLEAGAKGLNYGSAQLKGGITAVNDGASKLAAGSKDIYDGAAKLNAGANALSNGLGSLQSGSNQLQDGVQQLSNGSQELNDGMIKFNQDGINKLVNQFGGDTDKLINKVNTMLDNSKEYNNFSGISDKMDGEVKFVFITNKNAK